MALQSVASDIRRPLFRPGVLPTLVVLVLLPVLVSLGGWQLSRAEEKRALEQRHATRQAAAPVPVEALQDVRDPAGMRVHLHGRLDASHSLLLDNSIRDGQAGVELLQPFHDQASDRWVLVNRGWLPWPDRRTSPAFDTPGGLLHLTGEVYVPPGKSLQLRADAAQAGWPHLVTRIDAPALWQQLDREGLEQEVRLEPSPFTYRAEWALIAMPPERHIGYAVQWFALATTLFALYVYLGLRNARESRHAHPDA